MNSQLIKESSYKLRQALSNWKVIITIITIAYFFCYFQYPATPGNSPNLHPLGWWGWFDQGKYLLSSNALLKFDLSPELHFYPPLYPSLGALFLNWSSGHPYFFLNLAALIWFSYVFIRVSELYFPRWTGLGIVLFTIILNPEIFSNFIIPWTSTLSTALLCSGILALVWLREQEHRRYLYLSKTKIFLVSLSLGLLVPTRPGDAIVGITLAIGILLSYLYLIKKSSEHKPTIPAFLLVALIGSFCGPLVFIAFNLLTFGNVFGGYIQVASSNGFFPADIVEKFVSVWLDGFSLYGEPNSGLMQHYPWLIIGLSGLVWVMLKGDFLLKTVSSAIIVLFALYLPYSDLLPNGLWRYLNIHYFKWTFPFFGLFAAILIKDSWQYWRKEKSLLPFLSLLFIPIFLKSIGFTLITEPIFIENNKDKGIITATLPEKRIDFIDLSGVKGGFNDIYFGDHKLSVDGVKLNKVKDYRLIPQKSNVRLLFVRPIIGHSLTFSPDENLEFIHKSSTAQAGIYKLTVNPINIFQQQTPNTPLTYYNLNTPIDFSINGDSELFTTTGWSPPESWGRWSIGEYAKIQMLLSNDDSAQQLHLELSMNAFVNDAHPCQKVKITVNQKELAEEELCAGKGGHMATLYRIPVDRSMIKPGEPFNVVLSTPNSISPKQLGLSSDSRQLGIGLRYLNVTD